MSHTTTLDKNWIAIHDGDLRNSSDIILRKRRVILDGETVKDSQEIEVPFGILERLVAKAIIDEKINSLEELTTNKILYG